MVSQATEVRDFIETNWQLTGTLSKSPTDSMKEIVRFFDREQVFGNEWTKAVVVRKINDEGKENQIEHPNYIEIRDIYEITYYYRVVDVQPLSYSDALEDAENMGTELLRILDLLFSPSMGNGEFWTVEREWIKHDHLDQAQPELRRTLTLRMSKIASADGNLFEGYNGLLHFTNQAGHLYAELQNIDTGGVGFPQIPEPIVGQSNPVYFTGVLEGTFTADMYVSPDDIGSDVFDINQLGNIQSNEEVTEATFIQIYNNSNGQTITITTQVKISSILFVANVSDLLKFRMVGEMIDYPTTVVA